MKRVIAVLASIMMVGALSGCVLPVPTHDIMFTAGSSGKGDAIIVTVNVTFLKGSENSGTDYPHIYPVTGDFEHHQIAQQGTVSGTSIRVAGTVKGQTVSCGILIDGKPILPSNNSARYPKEAVCIGPPV